jgi:hypothetical protein
LVPAVLSTMLMMQSSALDRSLFLELLRIVRLRRRSETVLYSILPARIVARLLKPLHEYDPTDAADSTTPFIGNACTQEPDEIPRVLPSTTSSNSSSTHPSAPPVAAEVRSSTSGSGSTRRSSIVGMVQSAGRRLSTSIQGSILGTPKLSDASLAHDVSARAGALRRRSTAGIDLVLERCTKTTVLCCDLVGSTAFGSKSSPERIYALYAELYSRFDALCDEYDVQKITTMGDAYVAACGKSFHPKKGFAGGSSPLPVLVLAARMQREGQIVLNAYDDGRTHSFPIFYHSMPADGEHCDGTTHSILSLYSITPFYHSILSSIQCSPSAHTNAAHHHLLATTHHLLTTTHHLLTTAHHHLCTPQHSSYVLAYILPRLSVVCSGQSSTSTYSGVKLTTGPPSWNRRANQGK